MVGEVAVHPAVEHGPFGTWTSSDRWLRQMLVLATTVALALAWQRWLAEHSSGRSKPPAMGAARKGYGVLAQLMGRDGAKIALAEAEAIVRASRCFVWDAIERAYAEATEGPVSADTTVNLQLSMVHSVHEAARSVDLVFHQAGSRSVFTSNELSRCFRDIHTATQHIIVFKPNYRTLGEYLFTKDQPDGPQVGPGVFFAR